MKKIFIDMDGVLADFNGQPNALERFITEKGFFLKLKPLPFIEKVRKALESDTLAPHIYILSASPNEKGDAEKIKWLKKHLPNLHQSNIIIVRGGEKKKHYAGYNRILLDDYTGNLQAWQEHGGTPVKFLNGGNGKSGTKDRKCATKDTEVWELFLNF